MSKVTSKLQVTIPKHIAASYGIVPGTDVAFEPAGETIRVVVAGATEHLRPLEERIEIFRAMMARVRKQATVAATRPKDRGWTRDELYGDRGLPR